MTGFDWSVLQIKTKIVSCHTADSKPVKQYSDTSPFSIPWLKVVNGSYYADCFLYSTFIAFLLHMKQGIYILNRYFTMKVL